LAYQPPANSIFLSETNQPPATSQQYFFLRTNQHRPPATSQTNRLYNGLPTVHAMEPMDLPACLGYRGKVGSNPQIMF
jgi:hypothetical protein